MPKLSKADQQLGEIAVDRGFCTRAQLDLAVSELDQARRQGAEGSLPDMLLARKIIETDQLYLLSQLQFFTNARDEDRSLGNQLVDAGIVTEEQVGACCEEQRELYNRGAGVRRLGKILVEKGYATAQKIDPFENSPHRTSNRARRAPSSPRHQRDDSTPSPTPRRRGKSSVLAGKKSGTHEQTRLLAGLPPAVTFGASFLVAFLVIYFLLLSGNSTLPPEPGDPRTARRKPTPRRTPSNSSSTSSDLPSFQSPLDINRPAPRPEPTRTDPDPVRPPAPKPVEVSPPKPNPPRESLDSPEKPAQPEPNPPGPHKKFSAQEERALELFRRAQQQTLSKDFSEALSSLAYLLKLVGDDPVVRAEIDRVENQRREDVALTLIKARKLLNSGDRRGARRKVEVVLFMHPGHHEATRLLDKIQSGR